MPIAIYGINGDNETSINKSKSININYIYADTLQEVNINNQSQPIELFIPRFSRYNTTNSSIFIANKTYLNSLNQMPIFYFNIKSLIRYALNIHVIPVANNFSQAINTSYKILLKFAYVSLPSELEKNYDHMKYFCPNGKIIQKTIYS